MTTSRSNHGRTIKDILSEELQEPLRSEALNQRGDTKIVYIGKLNNLKWALFRAFYWCSTEGTHWKGLYDNLPGPDYTVGER